jgi:hypothetical protein
MTRTKHGLSVLLIALGLATATDSVAQTSLELIWSATTGAGTPGSSAIAAEAGDQISLDVRLQIDFRGVQQYLYDLLFDVDLLDELDIVSIDTSMSPYVTTSGPTSTQESQLGVLDGRLLAFLGIAGGPGPCTLCTVTVARVVFQATSNLVTDGDDAVAVGSVPFSFQDDAGGFFVPLFLAAEVDSDDEETRIPALPGIATALLGWLMVGWARRKLATRPLSR